MAEVLDRQKHEYYQRLHCMGRFLYCCLKEAIDVDQDLKKGKMYATLLRDKFPGVEERDYLRDNLLTTRQWEDLRRLVEILKTGQTKVDIVDLGKVDNKNIHKQVLTDYEKTIAKKIIAKPARIIEALKLSELTDIMMEWVLDEYGRCDLRIRDKDSLYVVEIKDETADHKIIGQVVKYIHGALRIMKNCPQYNYVTGVVIAPSYTKDTLIQLKSRGIIALVIDTSGIDYRLECV